MTIRKGLFLRVKWRIGVSMKNTSHMGYQDFFGRKERENKCRKYMNDNSYKEVLQLGI